MDIKSKNNQCIYQNQMEYKVSAQHYITDYYFTYIEVKS